MAKESLAEKVSGMKPPRSFVLDASILENQDIHAIFKEDMKQNRIEFVFPSGVNKLDLFEECRALTKLDDFDTMFDLTMQMLVDKDLVINIIGNDNIKHEVCNVHITDRYQNMRGNDFIDEYPIVITWLTEFLGAQLAKKYPVLGESSVPKQAPEKKKKAQETQKMQ